MIEISLESKRKNKWKNSWYNNGGSTSLVPSTQTQVHQPNTTLSTSTEMFNEVQRRDRVIRDALKDIKYKEGDHVKPYNQKNIDTYGDDVVVVRICDNYGKFGKTEEWPKNENVLMLIHAYSVKTKENFWCTPGFLVPR